MKYELAKKLKKAGFNEKITRECGTSCSVANEDIVYEPTLSELIEACGEDFRWLKRGGIHKGKIVNWLAQGRKHPVIEKDIKCKAESPEEAVANLWLELN